MVSLIDLAPSTRSVSVGGVDVAVSGVSAKGIATLLENFPNLQGLMTGQGSNLDAASIMKIAPDAIAAVIAAGCGFPGDKAAEKKAESLGVGEQLLLLEAIVDVTMPQGFGPFVESLTGAMDRLGIDARGKVPASNLESPSKDS